MPKISIITPIYCDTSEKVDWLDEMVQSVINQTVTDWELILINDKSPVSLDYIKTKYTADSRLRWLENAQNEGPAKTRNTAVAVAQSDCILPLDSDDMLADNEALEHLYDTWSMDKTKTIYGNVQLYRHGESGQFERSKVFQLAHYSFEGAMNLEFGIMPVSTMHSKEAHLKAGGWKSELKYGREDLEYWIACGEAGYCGLKINHTTLLYRKHEQSRDYRLKFENQELKTMQYKIKDMHSDIYKGVFPVACCGKGGSSNAKNNPNVDPVVISQQNQAVNKITELNGYEDKDLEWVSYQGGKRARFDVLARGPEGLPTSYTILGTGHYFQAHKRHHKIFSDRQHLGFRVNQPDPRQQAQPEPKPIARPEPQVIEVPKPELSTLVRMDNPAAKVEIVKPAEIIIEPNPAKSYSGTMPVNDYSDLSLIDLKLSAKLTDLLESAGLNVAELAETSPKTLSELPGIGIKRGQAIIDKAKELINTQ